MFERIREKAYEPFYDIEDGSEAQLFYDKLVKRYGLKAKCPHCGATLLKTDVKGYHSVCVWCDENFYGCEEIKVV